MSGPGGDNRGTSDGPRGPIPATRAGVPSPSGSNWSAGASMGGIGGLYSPDPAERSRTASSMCSSQPGAFRDDAGLIELVRRGESEPAFIAAVNALGYSGSSQATEQLLTLLRNRDQLSSTAVDCVLIALGGCKAHAAIVLPELRSIVEKDPDAYLGKARSAVRALCESLRTEKFVQPGNSYPEYIDVLGPHGPGGTTQVWQVEGRSFPRRATGLLEDVRFPFTFGNTMLSECRLRIYRGESKELVVVFTTDEKSHGHSVMQAIEHLATAVASIYGLNPKRVTWVEHYAAGCGTEGRENLAVVTLEKSMWKEKLFGPKWNSISRDDLAGLFAARGINANI